MSTHQHLDELKNDALSVRAGRAASAAVLPVNAVPATGADEQTELFLTGSEKLVKASHLIRLLSPEGIKCREVD
jgi:hypothetical protein